MTIAAILIAVTALGGLTLFALYPVIKPSGRIWWPGALHGLVGVVGFALLLASLAGAPPRGVSLGAGSFGEVATGLLGVGLLPGIASFVTRWRRGTPSVLVIGVHATLAIGGLVLLVAYISAPG